MNENDHRLYQVLLYWTTSFAILEPIVTIYHNYFNTSSSHKNMYQKYYTTHILLIVVAEYIYYTLTLLHTMLIYKYIFNKKDVFPADFHKKDIIDFVIAYAMTSIIVDILWSLSMNYIGTKYPIIKFVKNYSHDFGYSALVRPLIYGLALSGGTLITQKYIGEKISITVIFTSLFFLVISLFK